MNALTETPEAGTAIAIPEPADLAVMLKAQNGLDGMLRDIENDALAEAAQHSAETPKGRTALKSIAYRVAQTKTELERRAKALTEQQRREIDQVNAGRNAAVARLDALRDQIKDPAVKWEAAEAERVVEIKTRLASIDVAPITVASTAEEVERHLIFVLKTAEGDFAEFAPQVAPRLVQAENALTAMLEAALSREAAERELAELRAEKAAREAAEAEAKARAEAEAAQADAARRAEAEREAAAQRAREEEQARHAQELARAEENAAAALQAERDRIAKEEADLAAEAAQRAQNEDHVSAVRRAAKEALMRISGTGFSETGLNEAQAVAIIRAIHRGDIPKVTISY